MSVDMLQGKIRKKKNPTIVAMDLRESLLPKACLEAAGGDMAAAYCSFGKGILEALAPVVPAVKFNTAYYAALGSEGMRALETLCAQSASLGLYVMLETNRCDLEAAAELEAKTCFGTRLNADAVCISAFTGSDGVRPYLPYCRDGEKSVFLLARTGNKSAREVQDLLSGDRVIHTVMMDLAMRWSTDLFEKSGYSRIGVLFGASDAHSLQTLRQRYDRLFFLVPGYGVQCLPARDLRHAFDKFGHGAVVEAAGGILDAWQKGDGDGSDFAERAVAAAEKMREDLARHVTVI